MNPNRLALSDGMTNFLIDVVGYRGRDLVAAPALAMRDKGT